MRNVVAQDSHLLRHNIAQEANMKPILARDAVPGREYTTASGARFKAAEFREQHGEMQLLVKSAAKVTTALPLHFPLYPLQVEEEAPAPEPKPAAPEPKEHPTGACSACTTLDLRIIPRVGEEETLVMEAHRSPNGSFCVGSGYPPGDLVRRPPVQADAEPVVGPAPAAPQGGGWGSATTVRARAQVIKSCASVDELDALLSAPAQPAVQPALRTREGQRHRAALELIAAKVKSTPSEKREGRLEVLKGSKQAKRPGVLAYIEARLRALRATQEPLDVSTEPETPPPPSEPPEADPPLGLAGEIDKQISEAIEQLKNTPSGDIQDYLSDAEIDRVAVDAHALGETIAKEGLQPPITLDAQALNLDEMVREALRVEGAAQPDVQVDDPRAGEAPRPTRQPEITINNQGIDPSELLREVRRTEEAATQDTIDRVTVRTSTPEHLDAISERMAPGPPEATDGPDTGLSAWFAQLPAVMAQMGAGGIKMELRLSNHDDAAKF